MAKNTYQIHLSRLQVNSIDTELTPANYREEWSQEKELQLRKDLKAFPRGLEFQNRIKYDSKDKELPNKILGGNRRHGGETGGGLTYLVANDNDFVSTCKTHYPEVDFANGYIPIEWTQDVGGLSKKEKQQIMLYDNKKPAGEWSPEILDYEGWEFDAGEWFDDEGIDFEDFEEDQMSNTATGEGLDAGSKLGRFENSELKMLKLIYDAQTFQYVEKKLSELSERFGLEDYSTTVLKLIEKQNE